MDKSTLMLHRIGGFLLISCITVGVWVMIELFFPQEMLLYPFGWERLIPPGLSSFYNHFIVPVSTRMVVSFGHYKKSQRTVALLFLSLYGRFVNIVIILRKQYKSIMDPSRVLRLDRMPDVCFCEVLSLQIPFSPPPLQPHSA
ncbi:hypothetical protein GUITHDRAFT_151672 [Guillardia theta CCMP2712]|uniref:Uncharacterized protein n=1 Tax=Guillardia theta (strain CCMP2712) TaxID=905079 RepID=L1JKW0_GUITC|nr:hypothetical protein GUITHDRAFT_151672 [Guillardia theta CCMP2712]EKX48725.1 hypothetical protein GUITHDRAFT_151672 [Guillardia theta CCMP2712]|eukprot:XP_005835705.1 hypothetical protein GUITHDRAFT_151672 [Guillardia theta CCMP2712]